jgi:cell division protein FtsL
MNNPKTQLLDEVETVLNPPKGVDLRYLIYVLLSITFVCVAIFPKIYLQQQIYFKSRDISKLKGEYDTLKEENRLISTSVESIKFKNQILDTLF